MVADPTTGRRAEADADVIVVGAGPAGSTAATYLARAGLDVLLLEKSTFPRPKVCGDGFTPRGIKQIIDLGIDCSEEAGWLHNRGLRVLGGGRQPGAGVADARDVPGLRRRPPAAGLRRAAGPARREVGRAAARGHHGHRRRDATSAPAASSASRGHVGRGKDKRPVAFRAPLTLACDGVSARLALSMGITKRDDRPMGVAVRRYYRSPADARRLPGEPPGALGPVGPGEPQAAARLRLDLRDGRRHVQRRPRHPVHQPRLRVHGLPGAAAQLAGRHARGVGLPRGERRGSGRRRRAADGVQPHAALPARDAAGRRRGRAGEPVQRRGHRLRDGVGGHRVAVRDPVAGPARHRRGEGAGGLPGGSCGRRSAATTASATSSPASSATRRSWASPPGTACPAARSWSSCSSCWPTCTTRRTARRATA